MRRTGITNHVRWLSVAILGPLLGAFASCGVQHQEEAPIEQSIADLHSPEASLRCRAAARLGQLGKRGASAVPELIRGLEDPQPLVQRAVARALGNIGPPAGGAVTALVKAMSADPKSMRLPCIGALEKLHASASVAVPALVGVLRERGFGMQAALRALGVYGPDAVGAVRELMAVVEERGHEWAIQALGRIGPGAAESVPTLCRVIDDPESGIGYQEGAAWALGEMRHAARIALPSLRRAAVRGLQNARPAIEKIEAGREGG